MTGRARAYLRLITATVGRAALARLLLLQLVIALLEGVGLTLLAPVLQSLSGAETLRVPGLGTEVSVVTAFALVVAVVALRSVAQWRAAVLSIEVRLTTIDALRLRLVEGLFDAEWRYLARQRRSHVVQQLTSEVERANNALVVLLSLVVRVLVLVITIGVAVLLSPLVGGIAALGLLAAAAASRRSIRDATRLGRETSAGLADVGAAITDSLASVRLSRAHDAAASWTRLLDAEARRVREVRTSFVRRTSGVVAVLGVVVVLAVLALVLVGRAAGMPFGELAALVVVASRILGAAQNVLGAAQVFANDAPALDALQSFEADVTAHAEPRQADEVPSPRHRSGPLVRLDAVTVGYGDGAPPVLRDVDLDVPHHGLVTLSGASGSGKSTLLDVVLGLVTPDAGEVLVDGQPLRDLSAWRARVGYVPQQTVLVPGTVWQNLVWSLPPGREASRDDAWAALAAACLDDVVRSLPGGLDAPLRDIAELSGGEQQRLSIARALVRRPELLVLDEATSALDPATEQQVLAHLLDGTRAVLLVTHRPAAGTRATSTAHLDDGRLVVQV